MNEHEILDRVRRAAMSVDGPDQPYEALLRRRDRKRRNQRIAAGVVGMAVFVAAIWIVTSVGSLDRSATSVVPGGAGGAEVDPFASIQAQLDDQAATDLFEVQAEESTYWRLYGLDLFDGVAFTSSDPLAEERGLEYTSRAELPQPGGKETPEDAPSLSYRFRVLTDMNAPWIPMPYRPETLALTDRTVTFDPVLSQAVVEGGLVEGSEYSVRAREVLPTAEQLDAASALFLTPEQYGTWTSLPDSLDPRIGKIARNWTDQEPNAYRKVLAIQRQFQSGGFAYDATVDLADRESDLLDFLTRGKRGFCQQYATAMAVLVRDLGLPARVAIGYQAGTETEDGTFLVQTKDAHAWVEVYFPDYGWLPFEPTPGRGVGPADMEDAYLNPTSPTSLP
jgi:transglutaminase-like putative cysteine protease